jgi:hypothetical protein
LKQSCEQKVLMAGGMPSFLQAGHTSAPRLPHDGVMQALSIEF